MRIAVIGSVGTFRAIKVLERRNTGAAQRNVIISGLGADGIRVHTEVLVFFTELSLRAVEHELEIVVTAQQIDVAKIIEARVVDVANIDEGVVAVKLDIPAGLGVAANDGRNRGGGAVEGLVRDGDALFLLPATDEG